MLSKNRIKHINALKLKKFRQIHQSFLVEGAKSVLELLDSDFETEFVLATPAFQQKYATILSPHQSLIETVTPTELEAVGAFQTNDSALAVVKCKPNVKPVITTDDYVLVLDDVQDPGNLGTIIRIADWYGITNVICSEDTTEVYNPKVIAASKGSFSRVELFYTDLPGFFRASAGNSMVAGAFLGGESLHSFEFPGSGFIVMGNESRGIGPAVEPFITHRITIPRFGDAESLNVGVATAVILDNARRLKD